MFLFGRGETGYYNYVDRSSQILANLLNRKQQILRHIKEEKLKHLYSWTFLEFTSVSKRLQFVSNRLYVCNESTSTCIETTCIETTLYRNDREPYNGITFNYFTIKRGVRQGDPLSPYLFAVAVEILPIAIKQNSMIKGITIGKKETKLRSNTQTTQRQFFQTLTQLKLFSSCLMILRSSEV